jgi:hypothetical protein
MGSTEICCFTYRVNYSVSPCTYSVYHSSNGKHIFVNGLLVQPSQTQTTKCLLNVFVFMDSTTYVADTN